MADDAMITAGSSGASGTGPEGAAGPRPRVAVLGTGIMGSAMARNLIRAGLRVDVWDRRPEATGRLTEAGATAHVGPDKAAAHADVVITMLPDAAAVTSVAIGQGMLAALRQGAIWAQMGTIGMRATQQLADSVADQRPDVLFVDAPVSGTRQPAEAGQLLILASGPESARPVRGEAGDQTLPVAAAIDHRWHALVEAGLGQADVSAVRQGLGEAAVRS